MKQIAILGSTGSIGTQTLDIIAEYPTRFRAKVLTAANNWRLLADQACRFMPDRVVIANTEHYGALRDALGGMPVEVAAGDEAVALAGCDADTDIVVGALVGYAGLMPTLNSIQLGKTIALANKETLVVAGDIMTREAKRCGADIIPVDSEHSAIFQCLQGEKKSEASGIFLTASGGPFRTWTRDEMAGATIQQALAHPNWDMGAKVTIDSASMMNKGFEMIEARWLFDCPPERIQVCVHPQSIVHSMVEFCDGSVKAQLGLPDMHLPIRYALGYPERLATESRKMQISDFANLTFEAPDIEKFPLLGLAYEAISQGGNMPCILNAANEVAVKAFLGGKIGFLQMAEVAKATMGKTPHITSPSLPQLIETHQEATAIAMEVVDGRL